MRKLKKIVIFAFAVLFIIPAMFPLTKTTKAANQIFDKASFAASVNQSMAYLASFKDRMPGSEGEQYTAEYIISELNAISGISPKNDSHSKNGIQTFDFQSKFDDIYHTSQNIVYSTNYSNVSQKVVIGCGYDAAAFKVDEVNGEIEFIASESINGSAASVATLIAIAKNLQYLTLDYNVEIVFFGASTSNSAGAKVYTQGISTNEAENILCMINLDEIAYGKNLYFYSHEIETDASKFMSKVLKDKDIAVKKVNVPNLNKVLTDNDMLELGYTHVALNSNNTCFMKLGITSFSFFAGDYSSGLVAGKCEYLDAENITYTENDNLAYIAATRGGDVVVNNLYEVFKAVSYSLTDFDFKGVMLDAVKETNWFFAIFGNVKLVTYLTVFAFVGILVIAMFVHYKTSIKAYKANVEVEFLSSVVKICEQIDETGQDENVARAVSHVIARDIKKDKTIKPKKSKK